MSHTLLEILAHFKVRDDNISLTSTTLRNAPVHPHENYADDDTHLRPVNSKLLLLHSLELLVALAHTSLSNICSSSKIRMFKVGVCKNRSGEMAGTSFAGVSIHCDTNQPKGGLPPAGRRAAATLMQVATIVV